MFPNPQPNGERIASLETEVENMKATQSEMSKQLDTVKRNQWIQTGAIAVIVFVIELIFKHT